MPSRHIPYATWRVSSRSASGSGNCVEVGALADGSERIAVRNSRRPNDITLVFGGPAWKAFVGALDDALRDD